MVSVSIAVLQSKLKLLSCLFLYLCCATNSLVADSNINVEDDFIQLMNTPEISTFKEMSNRGYIRALVVYSKTDFFYDFGEAKGIQIEYLKQYEQFLNSKKNEVDKIHIIYIPVHFSELIPSLLAGKGDIAAAFLTLSEDRKKLVSFASGKGFNVRELIVRNKNAEPIKKLSDLSGKTFYILKNSSYLEHLKDLNKEFQSKGMSPIIIEEADNTLLSEDILELVNSGIKNYSIIDDYKGKLWARVLPDIVLNYNIFFGDEYKLGWAVRKGNEALQQSLIQFSKKVKKGTLLGNILFNRYYKNIKLLQDPNTAKEQENLKQFAALFKKYGEQYGFDYLALIAQAYQESGLDNSKQSHRGAVGIMQLLPSTASGHNVGIKDISTVEANIHAGTKYLSFVRNRYYSSPKIDTISKFAFSWAAYNAGPRNVTKMRRLAKEMGLDENIWFNNVEIAAGKIIGRETVQYVAHIYKYYIAYKLSPPLSIHGAL